MTGPLDGITEEHKAAFIATYFLNPDGTPPPLNPELVPFLQESEFVGTCVKHPLVYSIGHSDFKNGLVNKMYEQKLEAVAKAEAEENWYTFVFLHERPYRVGVFYGIAELLTDEKYWDLLAQIWTDTENMWQQMYTWKLCLESDRPGRAENFMDDDEREALAGFPDELTIYRGSSEGLPPGLSWTLDRKRAEWFARRFMREGHAPILFTATVAKKDVIGYLDSRNEEEIVVLHEFLQNIKKETLDDRSDRGR